VIRKSLRFAGHLIFISAWALLSVSLVWPRLTPLLDNTPAPRPPTAGGVNYLIVAPERLKASAESWADYRRERGYAVQIVTFPPAAATVENIRAAVQRVYNDSGRPYPFYVLLLGQAHPFYPEYVETYLPAATVPLNLPQHYIDEVGYDFIASDDAYALEEGGHLLPIAFGRVPVTDDGEAMRVLDRTRAYETHPPTGAGRVQVELLASDSKFGPAFDRTIEALVEYFVEMHMPEYYRWHMLYGHPGSPYTYPVEDFPQEVARRMDQGALLVTYIGHGSGDYLGPALSEDGRRGRVFALGDESLVTNAEDSVVMMIACNAGEYDQSSSLAEALLLQPGGPVATYAASRVTLPAANTILGKDLFRILLNGKAQTAGEWIRLAESNYENPGSDPALSTWLLSRVVPPLYALAIQGNGDETPPLDADLVYGLQQHAYNLFGDPALALAYARPELDVRPRLLWQPFGGSMAFAGDGGLRAGQSVTVTLYTRQAVILPRPNPGDDLKTHYENANDKTVSQVAVNVNEDGKFSGEMSLPPGLPSGHYILESVAVKNNETLVGSQAVYLGWPPVGEVLMSTVFWWLVVSAGLMWKIAPRRHR
jgi:peptidase C25-like protein